MDVKKQTTEWNIDHSLIMKILAKSNEVSDADGLLALLNSEVTELLHHETMVCGYHLISSGGSYLHHVLQRNYPAGYSEEIAGKEGRSDSPLMQRWRATREPVLFQSGRDDNKYPAEWVNIFKKYDLRNIMGHGILDVRGTFGSYFIFSRLPDEIGDREIFLLKLITPHLHFALMRTVATDPKFGDPAASGYRQLSERQQEILRWINQGKTNKEIATILSMSEKNVKYHIEQIFTKLGVRSRAQAVSNAILLGLLN